MKAYHSVPEGPSFPECEKTGKRGFLSEKEARRRCSTLGNRIRTYRCKHCNRIHITSQPHEHGP
jgi:hypothetical protein